MTITLNVLCGVILYLLATRALGMHLRVIRSFYPPLADAKRDASDGRSVSAPLPATLPQRRSPLLA